MNKQERIAILYELDAQLKALWDIVLVGGAAMILHFGARRATRDARCYEDRRFAGARLGGSVAFASCDVRGGQETLLAIMRHVSVFRSDWAQKIKYYLQEQGWQTG